MSLCSSPVMPFATKFSMPMILNIFEGAAEIQAQVIARGLIDRRN